MVLYKGMGTKDCMREAGRRAACMGKGFKEMLLSSS